MKPCWLLTQVRTSAVLFGNFDSRHVLRHRFNYTGSLHAQVECWRDIDALRVAE